MTPTPPYNNSTRIVSRSTQQIIQDEFCVRTNITSRKKKLEFSFNYSKRGAQLLRQGRGSDSVWAELCERPNFFRDFEAYIVVHVQSLSKEDLQKWYRHRINIAYMLTM